MMLNLKSIMLFFLVAGFSHSLGLKSLPKDDGFALNDVSTPSAPPTQYVEWYSSQGQYGGSYEGLATSGTGKYVIFYSSSQGMMYSTNYGANVDVCINTMTYSSMSGYPYTSLKMSSSGQNAVALGAYVGVALSSDYGHHWTVSSALDSNTQWVAVAISEDMQYIYALQAVGPFSFSTNSGSTFSVSDSSSFPVSQTLYDVSSSASGQYVVVTNYYNIYASTDFGSTWAVSNIGVNQPYLAVTSSASGQYVAAISAYSVYTSTDFGASFVASSNAPNVAFNAITSDASGMTIFLGSNADGIYTSADFGSSWTLTTAPYVSYASVATSNTSDHVYGASNPNGVYYYVGPPTPTNWVAATTSGMTSLDNVGWTGISASQSGQYVVAYSAYGGGIYASSDYGESYVPSNTNYYTYTYDVIMAADGQTMMAVQTNGLVVSYDAGITWEPSGALPPPPPYTYNNWQTLAASSNLQYVFAAQNYDTLVWVSEDFGDSFRNVTMKPLGTIVASGCSGDGMYVVFVCSGYIYVSSTFGASWTEVSTYSQYSSVTVSSSGQFMAAATTTYNAESIWLSADYGLTWTQANVPTSESYVAITSDSTGQYLAAIRYNVPVIQSSDFGTTWVTGDAPTFEANNWKAIASDSSGVKLFAAQSYGGLYSEFTGITASPTVYSVPTPAPSRPTRLPTWPPTFSPSSAPEYFPGDNTQYMSWSGVVSSPSGKYVVGVGTNYYNTYYSANYGRSFAQSTLYEAYQVADVVFGSSEENVIGLQNYVSNPFIVSGNYGASFGTPYTANGLPNTYWTAIAASTDLVTVFALQQYSLYRSTSGGTTFSTVSIPYDTNGMSSFNDIACSSDAQYVYLVAGYNVIFMSSDYGASFSATSSPSTSWSAVATSSSGQYVYAGAYGLVYLSSNFGSSFSVVENIPYPSLTYIYSIDTDSTGQFVYAVVNEAPLIQSADFGATWVSANTPSIPGISNNYWKAVSCDSTATNVYTAVYYSGLYFYSDNYTSPSPTVFSSPTPAPSTPSDWTPASAYETSFTGISVSQSGQFAAAYGGFGVGIFVSSDFGYSFSASNAQMYTYWYGVVMSSSGQSMMAISQSSGLYSSTDYGATWNQYYSLPYAQYATISASSDLVYVFVGTSSGGPLFVSSDSGNSFTTPTILTSDNYTTSNFGAVACSDSGLIAAASSSNGVFYSGDFGETWKQAVFSTTPNAQFFTTMTASASGQFMAGANNMYNQAVFVSSDYGASWAASGSISNSFNSVTMDSTGQYLTVASAGGSVPVYKSADFGSSWVTSNAPCTNSYGSSCSFQSVSSDASGGFTMGISGYSSVRIYYTRDTSITAAPTVYSVPTPAPSRPTRQPTMTPTQLPTNISYPSEQPTQWPTIPLDWYYANQSWGNWAGVSCSPSGQYVISYSQSSGSQSFKFSVNYGGQFAQSVAPSDSFYGVVISDSNGQAFAISSYNGLYKSSDYGATFALSVALPSQLNYRSIAASSDLGYVFVIAQSGLYGPVMFSSNNGVSFSYGSVVVTSGSFYSFYSISCSASGQYVVAGESYGLLYVSSDYGVTFSVPQNTYSGGYSSVAVSGNGQYLYAVNGGYIMQSGDFGASFSYSNMPYANSNYQFVATDSSGQYVYAVASNIPMFISEEYGVNAYPANAPNYGMNMYNGLALAANGQIAYASTSFNGLYLHNSNISAPTQQPTPYVAPTSIPTTGPNSWMPASGSNDLGSYSWSGIAASQSGQNVLVWASYNTGIYYSSDGGLNFRKSNAPVISWVGAVFDSSGATALALVSNTGLYKSTNGGKNWTQSFASSQYAESLAASENLQYVYIGSGGGDLYRSTDGGVSFGPVESVANGTQNTWNALATSYSGQFVVAALNYASVLVSTDYGVTFSVTNVPVDSNADYESLTVSSSGQYMAVGAGGWEGQGIYISSDFGLTWQQSSTPIEEGIRSLAVDASGRYLVAIAESVPIIQSNDFGVTWYTGDAPLSYRYNWEAVASDASGDRLFGAVDYSAIMYKVNAVPSQVPTAMPSTAAPSAVPSVAPSISPSAVPSVTPSIIPSAVPSVTPSIIPSVVPSVAPSIAPSAVPSVYPSIAPSAVPSVAPSIIPSVVPSISPSAVPSVSPTIEPSVLPTAVPTTTPSTTPSEVPSALPSASPTTAAPSPTPSQSPSNAPVLPGNPTLAPVTGIPTAIPSTMPSLRPSEQPTLLPSTLPTTAVPSVVPTTATPSVLPTVMPFATPTTLPSMVTIATTSPSRVPTLTPSVSQTVTQAPTILRLPTAAPTAIGQTNSPSLVSPTLLPTTTPTLGAVTFYATQTIVGLTLNQYYQDPTTNAQVIAQTASDCMTDVDPEDIHYVTASTPVSSGEKEHLRRNLQSTSNSIVVSYMVSTSVSGASYTSLSSELSSAVQSGTFTALMNQNAAASGATDLSVASSDSVATVNQEPLVFDDDFGANSTLSGGAIAGIVIAIVVAMAVTFAIYTYCSRQMSAANTSSKAANVLAAVNEMEMQEKTNASSTSSETVNPIMLSAKRSQPVAVQAEEEARDAEAPFEEVLVVAEPILQTQSSNETHIVK